jgi:hypothetical protein
MTLHVYEDLEQGTEEWHDARRGIVTASVVGRLVMVGPPAPITVACPTCKARPEHPCVSVARKQPTPIKSLHDARSLTAQERPPVYAVADTEASRGLTFTLIAERIAGWTEDTPMTSDMWRGVEAEPYARDVYSGYFQQAEEVGFMLREEDGWQLGYSPDGVVGTDGLIEIKAPRAKTHLQTILADEVPAYYMPQLQAGLLVSGRKWIDYVSFVGGMPLFVKRVTPDPQWFEAIVAAVKQFEIKVAEIVGAYNTATADLPATERPSLEIVI